MRNLQIGSGRVQVINGRTKTHHRSPSPKGNSDSGPSIKSHKQQSSKLTGSVH